MPTNVTEVSQYVRGLSRGRPLGFVSVTEFGAKGDGVTDDAPAIQAAHDSLAGQVTRGTLYFPSPPTPSGVYKINSELSFNMSYVSVLADGATLNASALTSGAAVTITGSVDPPYDQAVSYVQGLRVVGPGKASSVIGFRFLRSGCPPGDTSGAGPSHIHIRSCLARDFDKGFSVESHAYVLTLLACDAFLCKTCLSMPAGACDSGERILLLGCTLFNSDLAISAKDLDSDLYLQGTSLDYNVKQIEIDRAHVFAAGVHIEAQSYTATPITVTGDGGALYLSGGWILITGAVPNTPDLISCSTPANGPGGVVLDGVFLNNIGSTSVSSPRLVSEASTGPVRVRDVFSYEPAGSFPTRLLGKAQNRLIDGGFENAAIQDDIFITDDTNPISSRFVGQNITLSTDPAFHRTGTRSLKYHKAFGGGSLSGFGFVVPVRHGAIGDYELFCLRPAAGSGSIQ